MKRKEGRFPFKLNSHIMIYRCAQRRAVSFEDGEAQRMTYSMDGGLVWQGLKTVIDRFLSPDFISTTGIETKPPTPYMRGGIS